MLYDLKKQLDIDRLRLNVEADIAAGEVVEYKRKALRTPSQNRYLHLVLGVVALETGNTLEYTKLEYFKKMVNAEYFRTEKKDRFLGNVEVWRSTKDISKEDLSVCIDRFKKWAASERIYIPDQEDKARLRDVEMEMARARTWL